MRRWSICPVAPTGGDDDQICHVYAREQEQFLFTLAATIHAYMVNLDASNRYGRIVYPA